MIVNLDDVQFWKLYADCVDEMARRKVLDGSGGDVSSGSGATATPGANVSSPAGFQTSAGIGAAVVPQTQVFSKLDETELAGLHAIVEAEAAKRREKERPKRKTTLLWDTVDGEEEEDGGEGAEGKNGWSAGGKVEEAVAEDGVKAESGSAAGQVETASDAPSDKGPEEKNTEPPTPSSTGSSVAFKSEKPNPSPVPSTSPPQPIRTTLRLSIHPGPHSALPTLETTHLTTSPAATDHLDDPAYDIFDDYSSLPSPSTPTPPNRVSSLFEKLIPPPRSSSVASSHAERKKDIGEAVGGRSVHQGVLLDDTPKVSPAAEPVTIKSPVRSTPPPPPHALTHAPSRRSSSSSTHPPSSSSPSPDPDAETKHREKVRGVLRELTVPQLVAAVRDLIGEVARRKSGQGCLTTAREATSPPRTLPNLLSHLPYSRLEVLCEDVKSEAKRRGVSV
ncbi:hypothetical protein HK104_010630 [Borealophlyctis nickersoniae]|nr:hypothetical protein HK104_010630 [Borealophlyctis nickersoniae]